MTKADIVNAINKTISLPKKDSQEMVELILSIMKETLVSGESIKISTFGTFNVRKKNSRIGRNLKTGEDIEITARKVVTFRPSNIINTIVNSK